MILARNKTEMDKNDLEVQEQDRELDDQNSNSGGWNKETGIIAFLTFLAGVFGITAWIKDRALRKEREKNKLYQEIIRKHQAEIDALKNAKEREEYKNKLWEVFIKQSKQSEN